jgi:uncharacterized RDD family membrane protein YckC
MDVIAKDALLEGLKRGDIDIVRVRIRDRLLAAVLDLVYVAFLWVAAAWVLRDLIDDKAAVFAWLNPQQTAGLVAGYFVLSWWLRGQTVGMIQAGIQVVRRKDGGHVGMVRAVARFALVVVELIPAGIFWWGPMLLDKHGEALHDDLTGTAVRYH